MRRLFVAAQCPVLHLRLRFRNASRAPKLLIHTAVTGREYSDSANVPRFRSSQSEDAQK
jgi:hypothetical protein